MSGSAQMIGLALPVGTGKTERALRMARDALAAGQARRVVLAVPDHRLSAEVEKRANAVLGCQCSVATWRGQDQPDPADPAHRMCRRPAEAEEVRRAGGSLSDLCATCPLHPARGGPCAYRGQEARVKAAGLVIVPHACLRAAPPVALARPGDAAADLLVIDEAFWTSLICGPATADVAGLDPALWNPAALLPGGYDTLRAGLARLALGDLHKALGALPAGRVDRDVLTAHGVTNASALRDARAFVWAFKVKLPALPASGTAAALRAALTGAASINRRVQDVVRVLSVIADVLAGRLGPAALRVEDTAGGRVLRLRWREEIHAGWIGKGGVIHADATMSDGIARVFLPDLVVMRPLPPGAPWMVVKQITDTAFGYGSVIEAKARSEDARKAARANLGRLLRLIETVDRRHPGGTLAVLPKAVETALAGKLPGGVGTLHFGNLRGVDAYGRAAAAVIVSRPLPPPREVEDYAELLFGPGVQRLPDGKFYPKVTAHLSMAEGSHHPVETPRHPDPRAEAVRAAICDAELAQAAGRVRGLRRKEDNPVTIYVLTNTPMPDTFVSETRALPEAWAEWGGADPVAALLEAGIVPEDWPGRGAVLRKLGFLAGVKDVADAARVMFRRWPGADARLGAGAGADGGEKRECRSNLDKEGYIEERPAFAHESTPGSGTTLPVGKPWPRFRYRLAGRRKGGVVAVDPRHSDPRAAAEAAGLGPLDAWAPAGNRARRPRSQAPAQAAAPMPDAPAPLFPLPAPPRLLALPAPPPLLALPAPAPPVAAQPVPVELTAVLAALGMLQRDVGRILTRSLRARRLARKLEAQGHRRELREARIVQLAVGPTRWAAAMAEAEAHPRCAT